MMTIHADHDDNMQPTDQADDAEQPTKKKKFVNVDHGKEFYIGLLMQKKVRHLRGEFSQLAFNHHIMPSARMALIELNRMINDSKCEDEDLSVEEFLCVDTYTAIAEAKRPRLSSSVTTDPLQEIGIADHVVRLELYDLKEEMPSEIEFACNAVLAKFKATGQRVVTSVSFEELNDNNLIMHAQHLFGKHVGKLTFRKPFQPYACEFRNADGEVSEYSFRVKPTGRFKRQLATDVWTLKPLKEKRKDDDVTPAPRDEVFSVLFQLFPTSNRYDRTHATHFDRQSVHRLQNVFENAISTDIPASWKEIGSHASLGKKAVDVLKTEDLLVAINFLFFHFKFLWPYSMRGVNTESSGAMALLQGFVRDESRRFYDKRLTHYTRPRVGEDDEDNI